MRHVLFIMCRGSIYKVAAIRASRRGSAGRRREGKKERKRDGERYSLRTREYTRWSFVRCEIHSAFTYRRTSAIVNSLNKLFQLQEQRRCNIESHSQLENWSLRRILDRTQSKVEKPWTGLSAHWDMKFEPFAFLLPARRSEQLCNWYWFPFVRRNVRHLQAISTLGKQCAIQL